MVRDTSQGQAKRETIERSSTAGMNRGLNKEEMRSAKLDRDGEGVSQELKKIRAGHKVSGGGRV